jgi:tetratricopeptide (TPR) repeat protein
MTETMHSSSDRDRRQPVLTPPEEDKVSKKDTRLTVLLSTAGLLVLLGIAAMVIWLLPQTASRKTTAVIQSTTPSATVVNEPAPDKTDQAAVGAERLLGEWLQLQARAEAENIAVWGADRYPAILAEAARGDQMYQGQNYGESQRAYQNGINRLNELLASKGERLASAMASGAQALAQHESLTAVEKFDMALAIDPHNEEAQNGAQRARNLEQVVGLYQEGLELEQHDSLAAARQVLLEAIAIDNAFTPAIEVLARVEKQIQELAFQKAMSRTLSSLNKNDTNAARKSLAEAARLRPFDASVKDAGQRLAVMEKAQQLAQLQAKAEKLAGEERWAETLQVYDQALALDPHYGFAEIGRKTARQRLELDRQVQEILSRPGRLQENGPRQEAKMVLAKLQSIDNPGPRLATQINELSELVMTASKPIEIIMRSDNETSVVIYRIGRFGQFLEKKVSLVPGSYTVVGSRPGYRDVRHTLKIQPGNNPITIDIRCEEPI